MSLYQELKTETKGAVDRVESAFSRGASKVENAASNATHRVENFFTAPLPAYSDIAKSSNDVCARRSEVWIALMDVQSFLQRTSTTLLACFLRVMIRKSWTNASDCSREPRNQVQGPQWRQLHRQGQERT